MTGGQHGDQAADGQDRRQRRAPRHGLPAPVAEAHARERERTGREQCDADARPDRRLRARGVHIRRVEILRERADVAIARGRACPRAQRLVLHEHGDALLQPLGVVLIRGERRKILCQLLPVRRQRLPAGGQRAGRRVELALPGRDLGRRSVERLLPGGELRLGILQLLLRRGDLRRAGRELCLPASYACTSDSMEYPVPISCVS